MAAWRRSASSQSIVGATFSSLRARLARAPLHHRRAKRGRERETEIELGATAETLLASHVSPLVSHTHPMDAGVHSLVHDRCGDGRRGNVPTREKGELSDARTLGRQVGAAAGIADDG